jgi:rod shape-determining protein MreD
MAKNKKNYNNIIAIGLFFFSIVLPSVVGEFSAELHMSEYFNLQYLLVYFFSFNRFKYFSISTLFILGLVNDSIVGTPFGISSAAYMLIYKIAVYQETIKLRTIFIAEWIAFGISIFITYLFILIAFYLIGRGFDYKLIIFNFLGSFFVYPIAWMILKSFFLKLERAGNE